MRTCRPAPTARECCGAGGWHSPAGKALRTFAILTTDANEKLRTLHDRMPAIVPREAWPLWLGEDASAAPEDLPVLQRPCQPEWLAVWPVPRRVGRVVENDTRLADRDPTAMPPPGLDAPPPRPLSAGWFLHS